MTITPSQTNRKNTHVKAERPLINLHNCCLGCDHRFYEKCVGGSVENVSIDQWVTSLIKAERSLGHPHSSLQSSPLLTFLNVTKKDEVPAIRTILLILIWCFTTHMGQKKNISSISPSTKSFSDGMVNSYSKNPIQQDSESWLLSHVKIKKVKDIHPPKCLSEAL